MWDPPRMGVRVPRGMCLNEMEMTLTPNPGGLAEVLRVE